MNAKHRLARWARGLPNVERVRLEQWTPTRARRADVHVLLDCGAQLALEAQRELITDEVWRARHRDYAAAGVVDVWFMRPRTRIPHVLFAEGVPVWTLFQGKGEVEARLGQAHVRGPRWWEKDLRVYGLHYPPCPGDLVVEERLKLSDLGLGPDGVMLPAALVRRLADEVDRVRALADGARQREERSAAARRAVPPRRPTPRRVPAARRPAADGVAVCEVCRLPLADVLVPLGRHVLC